MEVELQMRMARNPSKLVSEGSLSQISICYANWRSLAIRVRPPLRSSDPGFELIPQRFQRSVVQLTSPSSLTIESPQGRKLFVFDRVFGEDINQEGIWDYLAESTDHFVKGYNVSMLAYGQSGAGKSYTMGTSGPADQSDMDIMGKSNFRHIRGHFYLMRLYYRLNYGKHSS